MRAIIGAAAGIVAVLGVLLIAQSRAAGLIGRSDASLTPPNSPVLVNCGPHQRALVRQVAFNNQLVAQVDCVQAENAAIAADSFASPVPFDDRIIGDTRVVRVARAQPVRERVVAERVIREDSRPRRINRSRSWQKTALIIAGSSGAGAGIGALIGGKKGALIGAAVGGGAGTVYDLATRNTAPRR